MAALERGTKDSVVPNPLLIPQEALAGSSLWRQASSFLGLAFSPTLEELLVPSQETWCQTRPPGGQGPGTGPDRSLEFYMAEVIPATKQLSLGLRLGWAWLRTQPVQWGLLYLERDLSVGLKSVEQGLVLWLMSGQQEAGLCTQGLSCSVAMQGVASLWVHPETQKLDEAGGPSHSGP